MKKKILLLGATGFLGEFIYKNKLFTKNYKIIKHGFSKKTDFNIDLTKKKNVKKLISNVQPEIIINLASNSNVDECEKNYKKALLLNTKIVHNIAEIAPEIYKIQISTDHIYNLSKGSNEKNIQLINNYAKTKYLGELAYKKDKKSLIIRTNFFGRSLNTNRGIINWMIKSFQKKETIYVIEDIFFNPLHISTFCKILSTLIEKKITGIYNLGSKNSISKANFIKKFFEINKVKYKKFISVNYNQHKISKTPRPQYMIMNCKKLEKKLKIKMPNIFKEILKAKYEF
tara:strand:- start:1300 stop:2157 length:858 start_codon:yes stop_codon:yes gene_type:complete